MATLIRYMSGVKEWDVSEVEELRRLGQDVVTAWERWGRCLDEFPPDEYPGTCGEWMDALDVAVLKLSTALADHAYMRTGHDS